MADPKKKRKGLRVLGAVLTGGASEITRGTIKGGMKLGKKIMGKGGGTAMAPSELMKKVKGVKNFSDDGNNFDDEFNFEAGEYNGFDQALPKNGVVMAAEQKLLAKSAPKMIDYLEKHGEQNIIKEDPLKLAMQVVNEQEKNRPQFDKYVRSKFLTEAEYQRFKNQPEYEKQFEKYVSDLAKQKGFMGFDGEDGSDMSTFAPLALMAPGLLKGGKKVIGGLIKKVGGKALAQAKEKKAQKKMTKNLKAEGEKKVAQAEAVSAGVPPAVVAQATKNLPPEKAKEVAQDLKEVVEKGTGKEESKEAAKQGEVVKDNTMMYIGLALAAILVGVLVFKN